MTPKESLNKIADEVSKCTKCPLHHSRKLPVPGEGPADAEIVFIGEGPGFHENNSGRPFVGAAGKFLDELLATINMKREDVFITNVVKCRPPGNRDPEAEELKACSTYLERQIEAIDPSVIVTLGRYSMSRYFKDAKISQIHGQPKQFEGRLVVPMYHPAAGLHQRSLQPVIKKDFEQLPKFIEQASNLPQKGEKEPKEEPTQLSLF